MAPSCVSHPARPIPRQGQTRMPKLPSRSQVAQTPPNQQQRRPTLDAPVPGKLLNSRFRPADHLLSTPIAIAPAKKWV